jgi:hypothetical protein
MILERSDDHRVPQGLEKVTFTSAQVDTVVMIAAWVE